MVLIGEVRSNGEHNQHQPNPKLAHAQDPRACGRWENVSEACRCNGDPTEVQGFEGSLRVIVERSLGQRQIQRSVANRDLEITAAQQLESLRTLQAASRLETVKLIEGVIVERITDLEDSRKWNRPQQYNKPESQVLMQP